MRSRVGATSVDDWLIAAFLVAFTLCFRLLTVQMINVGPDEIDYWYYSKILFSKVPYGALDHRNIRWAIILPTFLLQRVLGTHPIVYIVGPVLLSCLQSLLAYDVGRRLFSRAAGALTALMLTVFPYMIRSGSQIRPGIFSITYLLAAFWVIVRSQDAFRSHKRWWAPLIAVAALVFCAYETKITNLYFVPSFAATLYAVAGKRFRPVLMFLVMLAAAFAVETLLYFFIAGQPLGQLSIISRTHLTAGYAERFEGNSFLGLFARFNNENFPLFWKLAALFYLLAAGFLAFRWKGSEKTLWNRLCFLLVVSFCLCLTFAVKSIRPLIPVEPYQNRYFTPILPWMFLIIAAALAELPGVVGSALAALAARWTRAGLALLGLLLALVALFYFRLYPDSLAEYAPELAKPREHVLALYVRYTRLVDDAWRQGLPVLSVYPSTQQSEKAIDTVNRVFLRWNQREAARHTPRVIAGRYGYQFIAREGIQYDQQYVATIEEGQVLAVDRFPFRVWLSSLAEERARFE